jgi:energy-coupling factor transport system substrate-specific component
MALNAGVGVGKYRYTTLDILIIAVVSAIGGVFNAYITGAWAKFIEGAIGPFGAALDNPIYIFWIIIVALLIPKPGVALATGLLATLVEVIAGSEDGSIVLVFGLLQGVGAELGFLLFRYNRSLAAALVAGALTGIGCAIGLTFVFGFFTFSGLVIVPFFVAMAVGDGIIGGLLGYVIARGVMRAGFAGGTQAWERVS